MEVIGENSVIEWFIVPANKLYNMLGREGECVKFISRVSGTYIHFVNEAPPDPSIKIGFIRGYRGGIEQALR